MGSFAIVTPPLNGRSKETIIDNGRETAAAKSATAQIATVNVPLSVSAMPRFEIRVWRPCASTARNGITNRYAPVVISLVIVSSVMFSRGTWARCSSNHGISRSFGVARVMSVNTMQTR